MMTQAQEQAKDWQVRRKRGWPAANRETAFARLRAFPAEEKGKGWDGVPKRGHTQLG